MFDQENLRIKQAVFKALVSLVSLLHVLRIK